MAWDGLQGQLHPPSPGPTLLRYHAPFPSVQTCFLHMVETVAAIRSSDSYLVASTTISSPHPLARLGSGSPLDQAVEAECEASFKRESHHRRRAVVWADQRAGVPTPGFNLFVLKQGLAKCSPMQIWLTACLCE